MATSTAVDGGDDMEMSRGTFYAITAAMVLPAFLLSLVWAPMLIGAVAGLYGAWSASRRIDLV